MAKNMKKLLDICAHTKTHTRAALCTLLITAPSVHSPTLPKGALCLGIQALASLHPALKRCWVHPTCCSDHTAPAGGWVKTTEISEPTHTATPFCSGPMSLCGMDRAGIFPCCLRGWLHSCIFFSFPFHTSQEPCLLQQQFNKAVT